MSRPTDWPRRPVGGTIVLHSRWPWRWGRKENRLPHFHVFTARQANVRQGKVETLLRISQRRFLWPVSVRTSETSFRRIPTLTAGYSLRDPLHSQPWPSASEWCWGRMWEAALASSRREGRYTFRRVYRHAQSDEEFPSGVLPPVRTVLVGCGLSLEPMVGVPATHRLLRMAHRDLARPNSSPIQELGPLPLTDWPR